MRLTFSPWSSLDADGNRERPPFRATSVSSVVTFLRPKKCNVRIDYQVSWVSTLTLFTNRKEHNDLAKMAKFQT